LADSSVFKTCIVLFADLSIVRWLLCDLAIGDVACSIRRPDSIEAVSAYCMSGVGRCCVLGSTRTFCKFCTVRFICDIAVLFSSRDLCRPKVAFLPAWLRVLNPLYYRDTAGVLRAESFKLRLENDVEFLKGYVTLLECNCMWCSYFYRAGLLLSFSTRSKIDLDCRHSFLLDGESLDTKLRWLRARFVKIF